MFYKLIAVIMFSIYILNLSSCFENNLYVNQKEPHDDDQSQINMRSDKKVAMSPFSRTMQFDLTSRPTFMGRMQMQESSIHDLTTPMPYLYRYLPEIISSSFIVIVIFAVILLIAFKFCCCTFGFKRIFMPLIFYSFKIIKSTL